MKTLSEVYLKHHEFVLTLIQTLVFNKEDADQIASDVWLAMCRSFEGFDQTRPCRPYLGKIAKSKISDYFRKKQLEYVNLDVADVLDSQTEKQGPLEQLIEEESIRRILTACNLLSDINRECLHMRYFQFMTYREIGEFLGIPESTAQSRVVSAKQHLRKTLGIAG